MKSWPEVVPFSEFFNVKSQVHAGYKQNQYLTQGVLPIIDQGSKLIGGYTNELAREIRVDKPVIVFGDHTRCVKYVRFNFALGADGVKVLEVADEVDPKFAFYHLLATPLRNRGYARHMAELRKANFWKPTLDVQRAITDALDGYLSRLEKALNSLEAASNLSHLVFLSALERAIEECSESTYQSLADCLNVVDQKKKVQRGWSPQCLSHSQSNPSAWAVLKTTAVQNMRYEPKHNKELPKTLEPKTHLEVQEGDFLMTTTGPRNRCGVVCFVASTPKNLIFSGKILRFRPDAAKLLPSWLELVLASHKYQKQLDRLKVGSSDSSVSIGNAQVLGLMVPVPSLEEQRRLVGEVQQMKALAELFEIEIEQEAEKFKQLRMALLYEAFSGKLGE